MEGVVGPRTSYLQQIVFQANLSSSASGRFTRRGVPMRRKTALLSQMTLVALLLTGILAVAAAEPPASAPISSAFPALLSTLFAAQPSPCSAPATAAERAIFSPSPKDLAVIRLPCGVCSGVCAGQPRGSLCALGGGTGPKYCQIIPAVCEEDGQQQCVCGSPSP